MNINTFFEENINKIKKENKYNFPKYNQDIILSHSFLVLYEMNENNKSDNKTFANYYFSNLKNRIITKLQQENLKVNSTIATLINFYKKNIGASYEEFIEILKKESKNKYYRKLTKKTFKSVVNYFIKGNYQIEKTEIEAPNTVNETNLIIKDILKEIKPNKRRVLYKLYYEGYTAKEIAEIEKVKENAIEKRLIAARKEIKNKLLNKSGFVF